RRARPGGPRVGIPETRGATTPVGVAVGVTVGAGVGVAVGAGVLVAVGVGGAPATPVRVNAPLNGGGVAPPPMCVPTRSQSGSRFAFRIHVWRSGLNGVPVVMGLSAESQ